MIFRIVWICIFSILPLPSGWQRPDRPLPRQELYPFATCLCARPRHKMAYVPGVSWVFMKVRRIFNILLIILNFPQAFRSTVNVKSWLLVCCGGWARCLRLPGCYTPCKILLAKVWSRLLAGDAGKVRETRAKWWQRHQWSGGNYFYFRLFLPLGKTRGIVIIMSINV